MNGDNKRQEHHNPWLTFVSFLLGIAALATTVAYFVNKRMTTKAYLRKWKDYDDCGWM